MKDVSIDIVLDDDQPPAPRPVPKFFDGTLNIDEDLSPEDLMEAQVRYLRNAVLGSDELRSIEGDFQFRFRYDLDGTAHWDGLHFTLGVVSGECFLRLLRAQDLEASRFRAQDIAELRGSMARAKDARDNGEIKDFSVVLDAPWSRMTADELWNALQMIRVAYVMMG